MHDARDETYQVVRWLLSFPRGEFVGILGRILWSNSRPIRQRPLSCFRRLVPELVCDASGCKPFAEHGGGRQSSVEVSLRLRELSRYPERRMMLSERLL